MQLLNVIYTAHLQSQLSVYMSIEPVVSFSVSTKSVVGLCVCRASCRFICLQSQLSVYASTKPVVGLRVYKASCRFMRIQSQLLIYITLNLNPNEDKHKPTIPTQ